MTSHHVYCLNSQQFLNSIYLIPTRIHVNIKWHAYMYNKTIFWTVHTIKTIFWTVHTFHSKMLINWKYVATGALLNMPTQIRASHYTYSMSVKNHSGFASTASTVPVNRLTQIETIKTAHGIFNLKHHLIFMSMPAPTWKADWLKSTDVSLWKQKQKAPESDTYILGMGQATAKSHPKPNSGTLNS